MPRSPWNWRCSGPTGRSPSSHPRPEGDRYSAAAHGEVHQPSRPRGTGTAGTRTTGTRTAGTGTAGTGTAGTVRGSAGTGPAVFSSRLSAKESTGHAALSKGLEAAKEAHSTATTSRCSGTTRPLTRHSATGWSWIGG
ncbi:hypothetical protein BOG92_006265 [Streptomyces sp. WAC00263]|nr:hypothetical protein BOG92_006265 [Streptomyces sp. WAC00263]